MYNSFVFRKQSLEQEREQLLQRRQKNWKAAYQNHVRPVLLEKYSRRINNFVVRVPLPPRSSKRTRRNCTSTGRRPSRKRTNC
jgi:hypothetical protein